MRSLRTPTKNSPCSPQLEKVRAQQRRPNAAKYILKKTPKPIKDKGAKWLHTPGNAPQ